MGTWRHWGLDKEGVDVEKGRILQKVLEMKEGLWNVIWGIRKQVVP